MPGVKIAALGDAHLGRSYYSFTTPEGVNQRERDFEISFEAAVELALAQAPDLVVWLGDIFDHPRPTYRSFRIAQRAMAKVRDHGIPLVVITGNHDTPRLPGTGSPYSALADTFTDVHFAHRLQYERFDFAGLTIHAVPQMLTVADTLDALHRADLNRSLDRTNLLLTHPRVPQVEPRHADINEIEVDAVRAQGRPRPPRPLPLPHRGRPRASGTPGPPTPSPSPTAPTSPRASSSSTPTPA